MSQGTLYIVSAPSGAGKTSLVKELLAQLTGLTVSVSHTTRPQRSGEKEGDDYFFITRELFEEMTSSGAFLEHARVFDHFYGTARSTVQSALYSGQDVLLEIDWQGARQIKKLIPECRSVFILPPSLEALSHRLHGRGQDEPETIARRMRDAVSEMSHYAEYDYLIINDDYPTALEEMRAIILAGRLKTPVQAERHRDLIESLLP